MVGPRYGLRLHAFVDISFVGSPADLMLDEMKMDRPPANADEMKKGSPADPDNR